MNRALIRANQPAVAILVFIVVYAAILWAKPAFLYNKDGSLRQFGVGSKKKTVIPAWLLAMIVAILAYLGVMYYVAHPQLMGS
tara:strand:- start:343 stop:591 length:249 start_codon:yes stop_codon:yes gene_type:complete